MERHCKQCAYVGHIDTFPLAGRRKDGTPYRRRVCKKCYHVRRTSVRKRNRMWLLKYKSSLACSCCGYSKKTHPKTFVVQALQFHHPDDNKTFAISDGSTRGVALKTLRKEIEKCVILCARCHTEEHFKP